VLYCFACFHQSSHPLFGDFLFASFDWRVGARDNGLNRRSRDFLADTLLVQPALKAGAYVRIFPGHS
jgi:hypothetical protein